MKFSLEKAVAPKRQPKRPAEEAPQTEAKGGKMLKASQVLVEEGPKPQAAPQSARKLLPNAPVNVVIYKACRNQGLGLREGML